LRLRILWAWGNFGIWSNPERAIAADKTSGEVFGEGVDVLGYIHLIFNTPINLTCLFN